MEYGITTLARLLESGEIDRIDAPTALTLLGLTATAAELNYCDGVTSAIQDQLNVKAPTYHASTQASYGLATNQLYGHAKASTTTPLAPTATGSIGTTYAIFALSDHAHPLQDTIAGIAGLATRLETPRKISIMGAAVAEAIEFDGSADVFLQLARLDPNYLDSAVPISLGGTGSTTAAAALTALGAAASTHAHAISDVTDLTATLAGKSNTGHAHAISDVTDLQTALDGKSDTGHGHAVSDITDIYDEFLRTENNNQKVVCEDLVMRYDKFIFNKNIYDGVLFFDSDSSTTTSLKIGTAIPFSVANSYVLRCHGYSRVTPSSIFDIYISFKCTGSAFSSTGFISNGNIIPSAVKLFTDGGYVQLVIVTSNTDLVFRCDVMSVGATSSYTYFSGWTDTFATDSTSLLGSTNLTDVAISTQSSTHTHALTGDTITGVLPISKGGTGATTASAALTALGAAASTHAHAISDVTDLTATLAGKSNKGHTHNYAGSASAGGPATTALACTGNAATATALSVSRSINDELFNGESNITIYAGAKYVPLYDSTGNLGISTSANPYELIRQNCSHTEYHLILGTSISVPGAAYTRYINMPALANMTEGDRIDLVITNNSAYTVTVYINNNTVDVNFLSLNGTYLSASDRVFASGERITLYAIRTSSGGALCWRISKFAESAF
jgi:hypothetical protein